MQYWRVISSAQADGAEILFAVIQAGRVTLAGRCQWLEAQAGQRACWWSDDLCRAVDPTHWLPMPTLHPTPERADASAPRITA